jgi:hypothetical protein
MELGRQHSGQRPRKDHGKYQVFVFIIFDFLVLILVVRWLERGTERESAKIEAKHFLI